MNLQHLKRYLDLAEQYVTEARELVHRQSLLVAELDGSGSDAAFAREALQLLEQSLLLATEERDRLLLEIDEVRNARMPNRR